MNRTPLTTKPLASRFCGGSSPYRRRRITWLILIIVGVSFYYGAPWKLPSYLKDNDGRGLTRANIASLARDRASAVNEIYGLIYRLTSPGNQQLDDIADANSSGPIQLALYADGNEHLNWTEQAETLNRRFPVVVFSKTSCPFSEQVKTLLGSYDLDPAPRVIEVDLRDDSNLIKQFLTRLTGRATFPNVIVRGKSIGGWDETHALHANDTLQTVLAGEPE